jgi:hypothetical protein
MLQDAVRKAEERAARLEMERNSRAAPAAGPSGGVGEGGASKAGASDGSHEAELAAEVKLLQEELSAAQVGGGARAVRHVVLALLAAGWRRTFALMLLGWLAMLGLALTCFPVPCPAAGDCRGRHRSLQAV